MVIRPPLFIKKLYPDFIWKMADDGESVYLTFDDGPSPYATPWVLDMLDKYGAKATFFMLGKNVELFPDVYREVIRRGHKVANHSYSHVKGWGVDPARYLQDVDTAADLIDSNLFRPPYAKVTPLQMRLIGERYHTVMWSILSRDYNRNLSPQRCAKGVIKGLAPGEIVVFHDSVKCMPRLEYALPATLEAIAMKNLKSKSIIL